MKKKLITFARYMTRAMYVIRVKVLLLWGFFFCLSLIWNLKISDIFIDLLISGAFALTLIIILIIIFRFLHLRGK